MMMFQREIATLRSRWRTVCHCDGAQATEATSLLFCFVIAMER